MLQVRSKIVQKLLKYISIVALTLLLGATILVWFFARNNIENERSSGFSTQVLQAERFIEEKTKRKAVEVQAASAFFHGSEEVLRDEWAVYVQSAGVLPRDPEILGFFYAESVSADNLDEFIDSVRSDTSINPDGYPDFDVRTFTGEERDVYTVIKYIEPFEVNQEGFGFDITSVEVWDQTTQKALALREPVLTPAFTLGEEGLGAVILSPVYANHGTGQLMGFVGLGDDLNRFFEEIFEGEFQFGIDFEIFDGTVISEESLIYNRDGILHATTQEEHNRLSRVSTIDVANHQWTIYASADPNFGISSVDRALPASILLLGILLSIFTAGAVYLLSTARTRALELADETSKVYRQERNRLQAMLSSMNEGVLVVDEKGKLVLMNTTAARKLGIGWEYIGRDATEILELFKGTKKILPEDWPVQRTLESGEKIITTKDDKYSYKTIAGKKFPVELAMAPLKGEKQRGAVIVFRDLSDK